MQTNPNITPTVVFWQSFLDEHNWKSLIKDRVPQFTLGPIIYQLPYPEGRSHESFSIADMTGLHKEQISAHYHTNGETEIHFVLEGSGLTVRGGEEITLQKGQAIIISPDTAHYTLPSPGGLVLAVVNTPPFNPKNNVGVADVTVSNPNVGFDADQFRRLLAAY